AVRIWDFHSGDLVTQIDLAAQPSEIMLPADGEVLGVVFGAEGAALWRIDHPQIPIVKETSLGRWQLTFSPTGAKALVGRPGQGYQVHATADGRRIGPALGSGSDENVDSLLGFSADEQIIVTGGPDNLARFWRAPAAPARDEAEAEINYHTIWPPSGDAVAVATPDAATIIIGDAQGDVHILPVATSHEALHGESEGVSFLGHSSAVSRLSVSADGSLAASAAADNTIRIWDTSSLLPRPFFGNIPGNPVEKIVFSPDASLVGVLSSNRVHIMDAGSGNFIARFELAERHRGIAFADNANLYVGSDSGVLRVIRRDAGDNWSIREIWQGSAPIHWLEASPHSKVLILVDQNNLAQQFDLVEGRLGVTVLQLPGSVEDVRFAPGGSRILFRTSRWLHRASSAKTGLIWFDAMLAPRTIDGARMVFGTAADGGAAATASRVYLPIAGDGFVQLAELNFATMQAPGLFGNKDELLAEWRRKLGLEKLYDF
ncbi:MAG: hypothetical protein OEO82_09280, partial [Gammaproteobacteria bacterium]|nr:hypothetical protein [Gammaproteobacteria bacterium]